MGTLIIERVRGGFNPLKAKGEVDSESLDAASHAALDACFRHRSAASPQGNEPIYRITRLTSDGRESIEVPEHLMPDGLVGAVRDELP
jgi:hypothetical protein